MDSQRGPPASKKVYAVFGRDMAGQSCSFKDKKDKECVQGEQPQVRGGTTLLRPDVVQLQQQLYLPARRPSTASGLFQSQLNVVWHLLRVSSGGASHHLSMPLHC